MVVIICDATKEIGYGHLKRCLVLASYYRKFGLPITFLMRDAPPVVKSLLKGQDMEVVVRSDHGECLSYLSEQKNLIKLVIIDHYEIGPDLEEKIFSGSPVLVMDDLCRSHWCDVLVDQTVNRKSSDYDKKLYNSSAQTLLGIDYTVIDPVYKGIKTNGDRKNILITFGATDPGKVVLRVLDLLNTMEKKRLIFHIPLSSLSPCLDGVKKRIDRSKLDIRLYQDLPDLSCLYERCGIAIGAPGTSLLERIYCGLINLILVVASNQREVGQNISRRGAALCLGEIQTLDPSLVTQTMTQMTDKAFGDDVLKRAMGLVDGKGPIRIIKQTLSLISALRLRPAHKRDLESLYKWQHEPGARDYFRNTDPPTKKEHQVWFDGVLSGDDMILSIIEWCNMAIGYIRLNRNGRETEVSILIARAFQGFGFARKALVKIMKTKNQSYTAFIHPKNKASIGLFTSVGFQSMGQGGYIYNAAP
ncbi:MAG: UDP-2,4-diacetamido-2,4,6-trideoxy-beta-L-altropyranose hydrolase [Desulfobacteraceae bacterium]|nr:UDP-2,4-diacetamido-2,4,6-trideoxy-beta-L-altropyranose hydrolase [Desulfobacteraceae bacterium]